MWNTKWVHICNTQYSIFVSLYPKIIFVLSCGTQEWGKEAIQGVRKELINYLKAAEVFTLFGLE